ncbi:Cupin 2 conserved barrel domain protein [Desulfovibrio sp. X2]|uniref:cupin domain-containing protein n=1 Tax=Desulfovibrio sp. X2 TaxID=941449 RepID=UPI000358EE3D|nr:cupin domain-containing protein [Desulfovibrio sp. X2]EPR42842.1 Cupin 2 conserved barrel domain protein [Desulfovibrio sp. X2]
MLSRHAEARAYVTKDGSTIRELMHPSVHAHLGVRNQSLAEARVGEGGRTELHLHRVSEELYHVTSGRGRMTLNGVDFPVEAGDTVCIAPGVPHSIANTGPGELVLLCCCAPAYSHDDTVLLDQGGTTCPA